MDKVKAWIAKGAQPSDRVARFLDAAGVGKREARNNPERRCRARSARPTPKPPPRRKAKRRTTMARPSASPGSRRAWRPRRGETVDFYRRPARRETLRPAGNKGRRAPIRGDVRPRGQGSSGGDAERHSHLQDAERLNGIELYVPREKLPATDTDEYYYADLIGLAAVTTADAPIGCVIAIHNFGAGDIIEIAPPQGATMLLPFTNAVVPTVDVAGGRW